MDIAVDTGQEIKLVGKSGQAYAGRIYADKNSVSDLTGRAIAVLANSTETDSGWIHHVNSVYNAESIETELDHFRSRDDISHLILIPYSQNENEVTDKVDDLIRCYIHR